MQPGEDLEEALAREVREEVGLQIHGATYLASQPWPFPASIMVAFSAQVRPAQLRLDPQEIAEAQWVSRTQLGGLLTEGLIHPPPLLSVARHLIHRWYGQALPVPA